MFNINQTISIPRRWFSSQDLRGGDQHHLRPLCFLRGGLLGSERWNRRVLGVVVHTGWRIFSVEVWFSAVFFSILSFRYFLNNLFRNCIWTPCFQCFLHVFVAQAWTFRGVKRQIGDFPVRMASSSYTSMKRLCGSANQLRIYGNFHVIYT